MSRVPRAPAQTPEPGRLINLATLVVLLVATVGVWIFLVVNILSLDQGLCLSLPSRSPGFAFVMPALVGLLIGRYSGLLRYLNSWDEEDEEDSGAQSNNAAQIAVAVVLFALVPIFVYEAIGVYRPPNGLEPITSYVRCSIAIDTDPAFGNGTRTTGVIFLIALLFGQWLWAWYPDRGQFRGQLSGQLRHLFADLARKRLWDMPPVRKDTHRHERSKGASQWE